MIWILISIGYLIVIFDTYYWTFGAPNNRLISALLFPTTRIIWAINTATIIWMCTTGNAGLVNRFLSWKAFLPLSRITYSVYLTHIWIVWIYWGSKKDLVYLDNFSIYSLCISIITTSYLLGFLFSVLFEYPISVLQNYSKSYFFNEQPLKIDCYKTPSNMTEMNDLK